MANPVTHLEKTIAGEVQPVTHLEHVIAEYGGGNVYENLEAGANILIEETADGKAKISASGEVSSEDTVARAAIAEMKDGTTIDSFGDVETALAAKADADNVYKLALTTDDLLPANTDLDNVKTVGCYYVLASATVPTITHRPTENASAFRVTVELAAGTIRPRQIYQEYNSYDKYIRTENSSGVFGGWKKVEADLSTIYTKTEVDTALSGKQNAIDSSHKLSADLVDDTSTTNKFATAAELEQIETNKNNISTANAELIELVDSGAKNLLSLEFASQTVNGVIFTKNNDGTVTVTGTLTAANAPLVIGTVELPAGTYVLSGSPSGGGESSWQLDTTPTYYQDTGSGVSITLTQTTTLSVRIRIAASGTLNLLFKPMLCTKSAWDVSQKFVPYRPSYEEAVEQVVKNSTYTATSENGTFSGLLKNAIDYYGITGTITFSGTVYTNTGFVYFVGLFDYNRAVNIQQVVNVNVTYSSSNNQGDVVVTGSSGTYTAMIDVFVAQ